jgi:DNA-directed RNA polymerase specialized sigma54-like protein
VSLFSHRSLSTSAAGDAGPEEGAYVTDGTRLFRVVQALDPPRGVATAVLEDCLTLELQSYAAADLWEMRMQLVRAAVRLPLL